MAVKLTAPLPPDFDLPANFVVRVTAVDAASGNDVTAVNVSNVAIMAAPVAPETTDTEPLFTPTTPLWLATPIDAQGAGN